MAYVDTIDPSEATGALQSHYELGRKSLGISRPPNLFVTWSLQLELATGWLAWHRHARESSGLSPVEYEIMQCRLMYVLRSRYVLVNHAAILAKMTGWELQRIRDVVHAPETSSLPAREQALIRFAEHVALRSETTRPEDVAVLREHGFSDPQIVALVFVIGSLVLNAMLPNALGSELDDFSEPFHSLADWA